MFVFCLCNVTVIVSTCRVICLVTSCIYLSNVTCMCQINSSSTVMCKSSLDSSSWCMCSWFRHFTYISITFILLDYRWTVWWQGPTPCTDPDIQPPGRQIFWPLVSTARTDGSWGHSQNLHREAFLLSLCENTYSTAERGEFLWS